MLPKLTFITGNSRYQTFLIKNYQKGPFSPKRTNVYNNNQCLPKRTEHYQKNTTQKYRIEQKNNQKRQKKPSEMSLHFGKRTFYSKLTIQKMNNYIFNLKTTHFKVK